MDSSSVINFSIYLVDLQKINMIKIGNFLVAHGLAVRANSLSWHLYFGIKPTDGHHSGTQPVTIFDHILANKFGRANFGTQPITLRVSTGTKSHM